MSIQPSRRTYIKIARQHAYAHGHNDHNAPSYLPTTMEQSSSFQPHDWIIDAIQDAYRKGRDEAK